MTNKIIIQYYENSTLVSRSCNTVPRAMWILLNMDFIYDVYPRSIMNIVPKPNTNFSILIENNELVRVENGTVHYHFGS